MSVLLSTPGTSMCVGEGGTASLVRKLREARAEAVTVNAAHAPKVIPGFGAWLVGRWGWSWSSKENPGNGSKPQEQLATIFREVIFLLPWKSVSHSVLTMHLTFIEHLLYTRHSSRCWEYNHWLYVFMWELSKKQVSLYSIKW